MKRVYNEMSRWVRSIIARVDERGKIKMGERIPEDHCFEQIDKVPTTSTGIRW